MMFPTVRSNNWLITPCLIILLLSACTSTSKVKVVGKGLELTEIEISYFRGFNSHRFLLSSEKSLANIQAFRDKFLMKQSQISLESYSRLAQESREVLISLEQNPAAKESSMCQTPFILRIREQHEIRTAHGCRASKEGAAIGKLIKDVEFALASSK